MSAAGTERRRHTVMFTDIVGYAALMSRSEERALQAQARHRQIVRPLLELYRGESIEGRGDESMSVFPEALDAVSCALAVVDALHGEDLLLHVGIHTGDVVVRPGELRGDGVNVAARISALSQGGGICVSAEVYEAVRNQPNIEAASLGDHHFRNVGRQVRVYALGRPGTVVAMAEPAPQAHPTRYAVVAGLLAILAALGWWSLR